MKVQRRIWPIIWNKVVLVGTEKGHGGSLLKPKEKAMKPIALVGIIGVMFCGCSHGHHQMETSGTGNSVGSCMAWDSGNANRKPLPPVMGVMTSLQGNETQPSAPAYGTLPGKIENNVSLNGPVAALAAGLPHPPPMNQTGGSLPNAPREVTPGTSASFRDSTSIPNGKQQSPLTSTYPQVITISSPAPIAPTRQAMATASEKPTGASPANIPSTEVEKLPVYLPTSKPNVVLADPVTTEASDQPPPAPHWPDETTHSPSRLASEAKEAIQPTSSEIRLVNSKRISLNYEIKNGGPAPEIDLWCTRDGRTWNKLQTLDQGKPPCVAELDEEDLYGFTLVVRNGTGQGKQPQEGDRPQVWVEVDITKPIIRLMGLEVNRSTEGRSLTILWKAFDKNLAPKPITLSYAVDPEGPWMPIASQLTNTGRYVWKMPMEAPHQYFIRVEAVDQVGNTGIAQTPKAFVDDQAEPSAAILAVEGTKK
jgi:hypothetical protein